MSYDSTEDTLRHIRKVQDLLGRFAEELICRGKVHDQSKLSPVEKSARDANPPDFRHRYGEPIRRTPEMRAAIEHHHRLNSHHPEHYGAAGVSGMDLADLVEMFLDWKAAGERYEHDTIEKSIEFNRKRYNLDPQLVSIFYNTAKRHF